MAEVELLNPSLYLAALATVLLELLLPALATVLLELLLPSLYLTALATVLLELRFQNLTPTDRTARAAPPREVPGVRFSARRYNSLLLFTVLILTYGTPPHTPRQFYHEGERVSNRC